MERIALWVQYLLPKKILTFVVGLIANVRHPWIKNLFITRFIEAYNVNMQEALQEHPKAYATFNEFFIRPLKPEIRPLAKAEVVAPVDGIISEIGEIETGKILQAKGHYYSVDSLLANASIASSFHQGQFITCYLSPKDYHRIHMPITGKVLSTTYIPGKLFSVQPLTVRNIPQLFAKNERLIVLFETELGRMAMVLVGAVIVGSIHTAWEKDHPHISKRTSSFLDYTDAQLILKKQEEMGYFCLGSTVIVLLERNDKTPSWLPFLQAGKEIKMGEALTL
jgi:phosphatidylserine decarboxylase